MLCLFRNPQTCRVGCYLHEIAVYSLDFMLVHRLFLVSRLSSRGLCLRVGDSLQENLAHDFFLREISIEEFRDVGRGTRGG
jgi:hypothetical protein